MIDIVRKLIIPATIRYTTALATSINQVKAACDADVSTQTEMLLEVSDLLSETRIQLAKLEDAQKEGVTMANGAERAKFYRDHVATAMADLRKPVDTLEMLVDKEMWPMPSYGDMIFEV